MSPPEADPGAAVLPAAGNRWALAGILASSAGVGLTVGAIYPLFSLVMEGWGLDSATIGLNAAMPSLAAVLLAPVMPRIIGRLGMLRALYGGIALGAAAIFVMGLWQDLAAWYVLRFLGGVGLVVHWIASEAWINAVAGERWRGRVVALYTTLIAAGFAAGPLIILGVGTEGLLPFVISAAVVAASALPLVLAHGGAPHMPAQPARSVVRALRAAPTTMSAAVLAGFCDVGLIAMLPLYGIAVGQSETVAVALLSVFVAGGIVTQMPIGWLGDRMDRRKMLLGCAAVCTVLALTLPFVVTDGVSRWGVLFLWGGAEIGLYTAGLILLGQRFRPTDLAAANSAYIALYEVGGLMGPVLMGTAMTISALYGLPAVIAIATLLFIALGVVRQRAVSDPEAADSKAHLG